jgi:VWFA-related protein
VLRIPPRLIVAFAIALPAAVSLPAQERPAPPVFKTGTEIVLVDFVVNDKSDRPVTGLTAADFVVKEDGKERPIVSFAAYAGDEPAVAAPRNPNVREEPAMPAAGSARPATVLLIDDAQLSPQQTMRLRPDLKALLARMGERSGSLALVAAASKVSVAGVLPKSAAEISAAVDRISGRRFEDQSSFPVSDSEAIATVRGDAETLTRLVSRFVALNPSLSRDQAEMLAHNRTAEVAFDARQRRELVYGLALLSLDWLAKQPGRHSLVIVSSGFVRDPEDMKYNEIVTRSLRVNAPIHFLDARGLQGMGLQGVQYGPGVSPAADYAPFTWHEDAGGSSSLSDDTGGITVRNTNDMGKGLGRLLDTMQTYYVVGYESPPHAKTGYHKIQVEARTKGLTVRARRGYFDAAPAKR